MISDTCVCGRSERGRGYKQDRTDSRGKDKDKGEVSDQSHDQPDDKGPQAGLTIEPREVF